MGEKQLGPDGQAFYDAVNEGWHTHAGSRRVLLEACRLLDQIADLDAIVDRDGSMITNQRTGNQKTHPALTTAAALRSKFAALVRQLNLEDPTE